MHRHIHIGDVTPFLPWLRRCNRHYLKADLFAGLTVAVVALPQSMAFAAIAGLPVQYGLYASIVPTIIGCLWGSSAHLITGPTTTASLVIFLGAGLRHDVYRRFLGSLPMQILARTKSSVLVVKALPEGGRDYFEDPDTR